jgi:hypothetical protein
MIQGSCDNLLKACNLLNEVSSSETAFFDFDRNEKDSFELSIENNGGFLSSLSKPDLSPFLPRGSSWKTAVGWRSICLYPLRIESHPFICITVHGAVIHSTRGAYPKMRGVITTNDSQGHTFLKHFSESLCPDGSVSMPEYGIIQGGLNNEEQARMERGMIEHGRRQLLLGKSPIIKTALLSDSELSIVSGIRKSGNIGERLQIAWNSFLFGNIKSISDGFPMIAKARLRALAALHIRQNIGDSTD